MMIPKLSYYLSPNHEHPHRWAWEFTAVSPDQTTAVFNVELEYQDENETWQIVTSEPPYIISLDMPTLDDYMFLKICFAKLDDQIRRRTLLIDATFEPAPVDLYDLDQLSQPEIEPTWEEKRTQERETRTIDGTYSIVETHIIASKYQGRPDKETVNGKPKVGRIKALGYNPQADEYLRHTQKARQS